MARDFISRRQRIHLLLSITEEAFAHIEQVGIPWSSITIAGRRIGPDAPPYIIAEVSANHGGDLARAKRIIDIAAAKGADAVKFQAYTADSLTLDSDRGDFVITADNPWKGRRLHALYEEAATPYDWFPELFAHAKAHNIPAFASVFGLDSLALLEELDAPAYKIASFEAVDCELIGACAADRQAGDHLDGPVHGRRCSDRARRGACRRRPRDRAAALQQRLSRRSGRSQSRDDR